MKTYVLYHADCPDGFCAAWVAHLAYADLPGIEYVPVRYGEPPPPMTLAGTVYILDFCYPLEVLQKIVNARFCSKLVILDHHQSAGPILKEFTAMAAVEGGIHVVGPLTTVVFDEGKSGCRLAWEHFFPHPVFTPPGVVAYVEDRDLWRFALPYSKEVNAAVRSYPFTFEHWDKYGWAGKSADTICTVLRDEGTAILRREAQIVEHAVSRAWPMQIAGFNILAVNATTLISETAGELAKGRAFGACYFDKVAKRVWSLRSGPQGEDVARIAGLYGGGGHKHAAGFEERLFPSELFKRRYP